MRMKTKTNYAGHSIFLAELPSNFVENSNKRPFLKLKDGRLFKGWALIRGGAYSIFSPIGWVLIQGGAYFRGRL